MGKRKKTKTARAKTLLLPPVTSPPPLWAPPGTGVGERRPMMSRAALFFQTIHPHLWGFPYPGNRGSCCVLVVCVLWLIASFLPHCTHCHILKKSYTAVSQSSSMIHRHTHACTHTHTQCVIGYRGLFWDKRMIYCCGLKEMLPEATSIPTQLWPWVSGSLYAHGENETARETDKRTLFPEKGIFIFMFLKPRYMELVAQDEELPPANRMIGSLIPCFPGRRVECPRARHWTPHFLKCVHWCVNTEEQFSAGAKRGSVSGKHVLDQGFPQSNRGKPTIHAHTHS